MGHNPAGPKSASISVSHCSVLSQASSHSVLFLLTLRYTWNIFHLFLSAFHFSLFATSLQFCDFPIFNQTLPLGVLSVVEVGQNLCRAQLCLCTVLSCSLRACLNFVIVLKLQARAALAGIPDSLLPHIGHLCVLSFFFQTQRRYGANCQLGGKNGGPRESTCGASQKVWIVYILYQWAKILWPHTDGVNNLAIL